MTDSLLKQSIVHWIQNQNFSEVTSFYNLIDCLTFAKIMAELKFDLFAIDNYNQQTNNNLALILENFHTFCQQLEIYYKQYFENMISTQKFINDFNLISTLNEETSDKLEEKLIDIFWYVIHAQLKSDEKEKYIQILQNMDEQFQIVMIQFYQGQRQKFSGDQLESSITSPIKQAIYSSDQENFYKIKYEEMINILDEKENEISTLQEQLQKSVNDKKELQKQFNEHLILFEQKQDEIIIKEKIFFELTQEKNEILQQYSSDHDKSLLQLFQEKEKQLIQTKNSHESILKQKENQFQQLQEQHNILTMQYEKIDQNYQMLKNKQEALTEMQEQIEKNKKENEDKQIFLEKQQQLIQTRSQELSLQLSKSKDLNFKQEIEISSLKKKLEITAQEFNEIIEEKQIEIEKLKHEFNISVDKKNDYSLQNISELKGLGSEFSELLEKLEKKQNLEKSNQETKLDEMQQMFTQQDLDHLKKECEGKLQMCKELSALNETYIKENTTLKQQLILSKHESKQLTEKLEELQSQQKIMLDQIDTENAEKNKMEQEIENLQRKYQQLQEQQAQFIPKEKYDELIEEIQKKDKFSEIQQQLITNAQNPDQLDEEIKFYSSLLYSLKAKFSQPKLMT